MLHCGVYGLLVGEGCDKTAQASLQFNPEGLASHLSSSMHGATTFSLCCVLGLASPGADIYVYEG